MPAPRGWWGAGFKILVRKQDLGDVVRLNIRAMAFGMGILWGVVVLLTGLANLIWSGYGNAFLLFYKPDLDVTALPK